MDVVGSALAVVPGRRGVHAPRRPIEHVLDDLSHGRILALVFGQPHGELRYPLQSNHGASRTGEVADPLEALQGHRPDVGKEQDPILVLADAHRTFPQARAVLQRVVVDQVEVVAIGDEPPPQPPPGEVSGPSAGIPDVDGPLVGQRGVDGDIGDEMPLTQKVAAARNVVAEEPVVVPPDVRMTDQNLGLESPRRGDISLGRAGVSMVVELVGAVLEEHVAGDLQLLEGRPVALPVEVGVGLHRHHVPAVEMGSGGHVLLRADAGVEPGNGVLLPGGDLHLGQVRHARTLEDVGGEAIGLDASPHPVRFAPVEESPEEGIEADVVEELVHIVADPGCNLAHVPPDRGEIAGQVITFVVLESLEEAVAPVDAIVDHGHLEAVAEQGVHRGPELLAEGLPEPPPQVAAVTLHRRLAEVVDGKALSGVAQPEAHQLPRPFRNVPLQLSVLDFGGQIHQG